VKKLALFALALVATAGPACDDTAQGPERDATDAKDQLETRTTPAGAHADQEVREFRRESKATLKAMDEKLERLERSVENASAEGKVEAQEELVALRRERDELAKKLDAAGTETKLQWNETERELDRRLAKLGQDINRAFDHAGDKTEEVLE